MAKSKKKVTEELARVRYIGPTLAETLYDDHGLRSIEEVVEFGEEGKLPELKGVGDKKAKTILGSAKRLANANRKKEEAEQQKAAEAEEKKEKKAAEAKEKKEKESKQKAGEDEGNGSAEETPDRTNGRAPGRTTTVPTREPATGGGTGARAGAGGAAEAAARTERPPRREAERDLRRRFIDTLRCPACGHDGFDIGSSTLTCQACQRQFNLQNGIADLAPPASTERSVTQKIMESRTYTRFYEEFLRPRLTSVVSDRSMREEYRLAADFLDFDDDIRLLDVGCGTANFTRYLAQRIGLAETPATDPDIPLVVGMDLSWPMLENARRNIRQENLEDKVFLLRGDGTRIPVRRGAYNRLHCAGTLHMMNDIDEALRNFARVLEPNGVCVIGTFVLGKGILRRLIKRAAEFPTRFHWFSRDELLRRIERAGFEIADNSLAGDAITVKARRI